MRLAVYYELGHISVNQNNMKTIQRALIASNAFEDYNKTAFKQIKYD